MVFILSLYSFYYYFFNSPTMNIETNLIWPRKIWPSKSHHNQCEHCSTIKYPGCEAEEIDQRVNGS